MTELVIKSKGGKDVTTSLIVAAVFEKNHKEVLRDIENMKCSQDFRQRNFAHTPYEHPQNGQTYHYYQMTKDGFSFLVMGYTGAKAGEFKETFINEFNKREALLKNDDYILLRSQEILQKRVLDAETKLNEAQKVIEENAPKVLFANAVTASSDSILIGNLAKILKQRGCDMGQNRLFAWMRENHFLGTKGNNYNSPTQKAMDQGLFEIVERTIQQPDKEPAVRPTTMVTGKGQLYFINKFLTPATA